MIETAGENDDSLITGVGYETNSHSDSAFRKEYLERHPDDAEPEIMIADGAYCGREKQVLGEAKTRNLSLQHLRAEPWIKSFPVYRR